MSEASRAPWLGLAALLNPAGLPAGPAVMPPDFDWLALYRLATVHLVAPVLYAGLAARGQLAQIPAEVGAALEVLYQLNDQRNRRLRAGGDGYVELHYDTGCRGVRAALSLTMVLARAQAVDWDGHRLRIPCLEHRLLHNALHHQVQDRAFHSGRRSLRSLLEFAQLRALPEAAGLDWPGLLRHLDAVGADPAVGAYLLAAQRHFGQALPTRLRPGAAARRAEARFWFRVDHPRLAWLPELRWLVTCYASRLPRLPRRLMTPAWYLTKYRALHRQ